MSTYDDVLSNYQSINQSFEKLRYYLIQQLEKCFITDIEDCNFTELIDKVGEIEAVESHNIYNIKPTERPEIDNTNYTTYNKTLFFRTRYYMKLLAYYLVLKGVSVEKVAAKDTLYGLISLIDFIKVKLPVTMTVQDITQQYDFGTDITLNYILTDYYGNRVKDGEITIESDDIVYDSIEPGQPIVFRPIKTSEKVNGQYQPITFTIIYHGSEKYQKYPPITREIIVMPAKIVMDIFMYNSNIQSKYYNSYDTGYVNDMWNISIKTYNYNGEVLPNIPFSISLLSDSNIDTSINNVLTLNSNSSIDEVTDDEGNCFINCAINQVGNQMIKFETTYEDTDLMTNTEIGKEINIYYYPLYTSKTKYIEYLGKNTYDYELIIRNVDTGEQYDNALDGQEVLISVNDIPTSETYTINNGHVIFSLNNINEGEYKIHWLIDGNELLSEIKVYSNFIFPKKNRFFLTDTPDIYYSPLYSSTYETENWSPIIRKKTTAWVYYYEEGTDIAILIDDEPRDMYTDANGILHDLKERSEYLIPRQYAVKLQTASDGLNETTDLFEYWIRKPFDIFFDEDESYIKEKAVFNIKIYDKEHYQMGQHTNYISFNKNFNGLYNVAESEIYDEDAMITYYNIKLTIPQRTETIGKNTLTVTVNNYSESATFKLLDKVFSIITSDIDIGEQIIEIQCYDEDTTDINVYGEYIEMNSYVQEGNIFKVCATFRKAGANTLIVDSEIITESFNINVNKGDLSQISSIIITKDSEETEECYYSEINKIRAKLKINKIYSNIDVVYNFNEYYTETYTYDGNEHSFGIPDVKPGTYNISFEYYGNDGNYIPFVKTKQLTILKDTPTIAIQEQYSAYDDTT